MTDYEIGDKISDELHDEIHERLKRGDTYVEIEKSLGVNQQTITRVKCYEGVAMKEQNDAERSLDPTINS